MYFSLKKENTQMAENSRKNEFFERESIAIIAVQMLHKKTVWKFLHFAFIVPAIIIGNSLRIVLTVLLYNWWGEVVLQNLWHTALGYVQIVLALVIFIAVGKIFMISDEQTTEVQQ